MATRIKEKYINEAVPALQQKFGYKNVMEIPKLSKIVINMGLGDCKDNPKGLEVAVAELATISGQKPLVTKARKSIANFKLREGMNVGEKGRVGHIVLMGSGEPLDNYDNTVRFLRAVNEEKGLNLSLRNVSVSTCGLADQIRRLAEENLGITLSLSLHAPNDEIRRQIMPVARRWPLGEVMAAVREYVKKTGRRVVFEYALIDQLNSRPEHAVELAALLRDLQCHVNLIPLNHVDERALRPASPEAVQRFLHTLESRHISATVRREMGSDIGGACGQLRRRELEGKSKE